MASRYPLRSARLQLRPIVEADARAVLAYRSLPEVCRWVPFEPMSLDDVLSRIHGSWATRELVGDDDALVLGAHLAATDELVGDVMLRLVSREHRCGELGYVFSPAHAGHGYASEAAHRMLQLAFDELGLHRVIARVAALNTASSRVALRLGMRQEAHLIRSEWFKGSWADELNYAILDDEWTTQNPTPR
ncbi:GNAT family N-acetyltransferase [Pseudonocardia spinosispora]|uniref:GNAT family N-acetyltransferase n=1 Tax=Pseudonocardia spinosispora TaxID=103441 RepID=UPI0004295E35|nr:GNAT family N-acetyltransferase [Pseudonocardia spinosispora]